MMNADMAEVLRTFDRIIMSKDPSVYDAYKQAVVLSKVVETEEPEQYGPLVRMFHKLTELQLEVDSLRMAVVNQQRYPQTGTYWNNTTGGAGIGDLRWTSATNPADYMSPSNTIDWSGAVDGLTSVYDFTKTAQNYVIPASPTEPGAFVLIDPDTGDSMSVKYK